ncbi:DUF6085 family protein [Streptomyces sp. NRRL F-2664]|uniref:DUF6085 family protein n=1 Tax=Streptomyces sp. NRRL F-2664 TaxID=1463842 RepID=UPI0004C9490D|nr:DUF6085 family protein [Streptomyces sp. NRRL F-2664]
MTETNSTDPHVCKPGASTYFCPTAGEVESDCHGGFDQCCSHPEQHLPVTDDDPTLTALMQAARAKGLRLEVTATEEPACCVCGGGPVVYRNYRELPFCVHCADCQCTDNPCIRTGVNDPAVSAEVSEPPDSTKCSGEEGFCFEHGFHRHSLKQPALPDVAGRCPACRGASLFLGDGGHVTCSRIDCPNPCAADELLHAPTGPLVTGTLVQLGRAAADLVARLDDHVNAVRKAVL